MRNNNSPLPRTTGIGTVRREQVATDPLFDTGLSLPQEPVEVIRQKVVPVTDQIELQTETFLRGCSKQPPSRIQDESLGLGHFAGSQDWKYVLNLSAKLMDERGSLYCSDLSSIRFRAMFKMKLYDDIAIEALNMLDAEDNITNRVALRMVLCEVKLLTGRNLEAMEDLHFIKYEAKHISCTDSMLKFLIALYSVNAIIRLRNWKGAIIDLKLLIKDVRSERMAFPLDTLLKLEILCTLRLSRLLVQVGAIRSAKYFTEQAKSTFVAECGSSDAAVKSNIFLCQGLIAFCEEQFDDAFNLFNSVVDTEKEHAIGETSENDLASCLCCGEGTVLAAAVNNFAVCALYLKRMTVAISKLETLILEDPSVYLVDPVVFNLCTLYDLSFAPDVSASKKKVLQKVASKFKVDDPILHWRSFRLN